MINRFIELFFSFFGLFGFCEFGERLREAFDEINMVLNQIKWYLLPRKTQKILSIMLMFTQRPVELDIFGSVSCNRITFKKVSKRVVCKRVFLILTYMIHDHD